jgi:DNA-binding PadR family transcriptional regulator
MPSKNPDKIRNQKISSEGSELLRKILRIWTPYLTDREFRVLLFVFDRTYHFQKYAEVIPIRHFINGIHMESGYVVAAALPYKARTIYDALQSLRRKGVLFHRSEKKSSQPEYSINPEADLLAPLTWLDGKRGRRKSSKGAGRSTTELVVARPLAESERPVAKPICARMHPITIRKKNIGTKLPSLRREGAQALSWARKSDEDEVTASAIVTESDLSEMAEFIDYWNHQIEQYFPQSGTATMTFDDVRLLRTVLLSEAKNFDRRRFVHVVITRWTEILGSDFAWLRGTRISPTPDLAFVLRHFGTFCEAHYRVKKCVSPRIGLRIRPKLSPRSYGEDGDPVRRNNRLQGPQVRKAGEAEKTRSSYLSSPKRSVRKES